MWRVEVNDHLDDGKEVKSSSVLVKTAVPDGLVKIMLPLMKEVCRKGFKMLLKSSFQI